MSKNKESMMRVSAELIEDLKLLKKVKAAGGKSGTHSDLVHGVIKAELRKTHADTQNGHLPVGCVVLGPEGKPVVIKAIGNDKVVFNDDTYVINGGVACHGLVLLADTIEQYDGGTFNV